MSQTGSEYDFYLELRDRSGKILFTDRIEARHFSRLIDDFLFTAICMGELPNDSRVVASSTIWISPIFKEEDVGARGHLVNRIGVRIEYTDSAGIISTVGKTYGLTSFHRIAREILHSDTTVNGAHALVTGQAPSSVTEDTAASSHEEDSSYFSKNLKLFAFRRLHPVMMERNPDERSSGEGDPSMRMKMRFRASAISERPFPWIERPLVDSGLVYPEGRINAACMVFVEEVVIEEIIEQTLRADGMEQAGFLIGHLGWDPHLQQAYLLITRQIPAREGVVPNLLSFTFLPESFLSAREALLNGEMIVGWQHNHHWCPGCPSNLSGSTLFFSTADETVQASAFNRPFQVAMVAGRDLALDQCKPALRMYGWREGGIGEIDFVRVQRTTKGV